jgi:hypothetical protein
LEGAQQARKIFGTHPEEAAGLQLGLSPASKSASQPCFTGRFLTFLTASSFVFLYLTALFGNFPRFACYFYSNFVM